MRLLLEIEVKTLEEAEAIEKVIEGAVEAKVTNWCIGKLGIDDLRGAEGHLWG
jgi:hypothetical protein